MLDERHALGASSDRVYCREIVVSAGCLHNTCCRWSLHVRLTAAQFVASWHACKHTTCDLHTVSTVVALHTVAASFV